MWSRSAPVDGFRLAFDRFGTRGAPPVVLLHGWPGNRHDYRNVVPMDWAAAVRTHPGYVGSDGIHLTTTGERAYSSMVATAAVDG